MSDQSIHQRINGLVEEEHTLLERAERGPLDPGDRHRLQALQVTLDQCWDLLRQRRARREFGEDPDQAHVRDGTTVERYLQ